MRLSHSTDQGLILRFGSIPIQLGDNPDASDASKNELE
jgi:hypothetical protein